MARGESLVRQWNVLKVLQAHRFGIPSDQLAARVGCSKRQVPRDLAVLQETGFPISHETRDFGKRFWKLPADFGREPLILSVTEMLSLYLGQQFLTPLAGTPFGLGLGTALEKIQALLPADALEHFAELKETLLVKMIARPDYTACGKQIGILNQAIAEGKIVSIRYRPADRPEPIAGDFCPYGLVVLGVSLYCIGFLEADGDIRTLKISRLEGLELTGRSFDRPGDFSLEEHLRGSFGIFASGTSRRIRVRCGGWAARTVRELRWHPSQRIVEDDGNQLVAQFELANTVEFKRWVLGFGRHAVVLTPAGLAREVAEELTAASRAYRDESPAQHRAAGKPAQTVTISSGT